MSLIGTVWTPKGPSPITDGTQQNNGMVTAIAVHPNDSNIIYIGTAGGGVWKTGDAGAHWRPLFDCQARPRHRRAVRRWPSTRAMPTSCMSDERTRPGLAAAPGRPVQVVRRGRELETAGIRLPHGQHGERVAVRDRSDQRDHRRPRQRQPDLSRGVDGRLAIERCRPELDAGDQQRRRRALPRPRPHLARERSHPLCRDQRHRRHPFDRWGRSTGPRS